MKYADSTAAVLVIVVAAGSAAYWFGIRENALAGAASGAPSSASPERKILYYRNPMGQPDTSAVPKKDSMGMDYIPVYAGVSPDSGVVGISPARLQMLGVQSVPVERRNLARTIRAVGTIAADERRLSVVNTKFEGWIEKLDVSAV